jgi:replicative DNA helicase
MNGDLTCEYEQSLLGALLVDPGAFDRLDAPMRPEHFSSEAHRKIFAAISGEIAAGRPFDVISIAHVLDESGQIQGGGLDYLGEMANTAVPFSAARHAEIVREQAQLRALMAAANDIAECVKSQGMSTTEKMTQAQSLVAAACETAAVGEQPRLAREWATLAIETIQNRIDGVQDATATGFADLDRLLNGGLRAGNLAFVAARPGMGKTSFALQLAQNVAESGHAALFCSQEMGGQEVSMRQYAMLSGVSLEEIVSGRLSDADIDRLTPATARLYELPLFIDEQPALTFPDVARKARKVKREAAKLGKPLGMVVVDYLQLMAGGGENRNTEIEKISRAMKTLAKELGIPVVVLSQLNRELERRPNKRPILSDLRDSGSIEQDADMVLMLYRDETYDPDSPDRGTAEILVRKHRQGKTGDVRLAWRGETASFGNLDFAEFDARKREEAQIIAMQRRAQKMNREKF